MPGAVARIGAFAALAAVFVGALGWVLPAGWAGWGAALLVGSLGASWVMARSEGRPLGAVGLFLDRRAPRELLGGLGVGVAVAVAAVGVIALGGGLRWGGPSETVTGCLGGGLVALGRLALPAAGEEVLVRGYVLQVAARRWGGGAAVLGTASVFGLMHLGNPGAGAAAVAGVVAAGALLGTLVVRWGSLWGAIGAHLGWNWMLAWPSGLPVSGLDPGDAPCVSAVARGPAWLSGGTFGPEASVVGALVLGVAAGLVWGRGGRRAAEGRAGLLSGDRMDGKDREDEDIGNEG